MKLSNFPEKTWFRIPLGSRYAKVYSSYVDMIKEGRYTNSPDLYLCIDENMNLCYVEEQEVEHA